jgi:hypothetical protein
MGTWPSSGHAMMDNAFHAEDMRLLRPSCALYTLSLWRQTDEESMTNAIGGCSAGSTTRPLREAVYLIEVCSVPFIISS